MRTSVRYSHESHYYYSTPAVLVSYNDLHRPHDLAVTAYTSHPDYNTSFRNTPERKPALSIPDAGRPETLGDIQQALLQDRKHQYRTAPSVSYRKISQYRTVSYRMTYSPQEGYVGASSGQRKSEKQQACFDRFVFIDVHTRPPLQPGEGETHDDIYLR